MLLSVVDMYSHIEKIRTLKNKCPWFSQKIEESKGLRDHSHVNAVLSGDWELYKYFKNKVCSDIKKAKKDYIQNGISENYGNSSKMWEFKKKILPKSSFTMLYNICDDSGILLKYYGTVASIFNS